jgi:hypothetical protein
MGLIREPEGVDFVVNSRPLTKKEQEALSNFIKADKEKRLKRLLSKNQVTTRRTTNKSRTRTKTKVG